jgi:hypothetical protein
MRVDGYLVVWTAFWMPAGHVRDVFYQGLDYANSTAQQCIDRGYQVWIEKRHCIDGRLQAN